MTPEICPKFMKEYTESLQLMKVIYNERGDRYFGMTNKMNKPDGLGKMEYYNGSI